jgi:SulP family sulfate permease
MPGRYKQRMRGLARSMPRPFSALRDVFRKGYGATDLRSDLMAGLVVAMVAIPLSMALAIASGVPPQMGLYTAIVAGGAVALLGGSRFQVTGPTAAFVVILLPIVNRFGPAGLLMAGLLAGVLLILMGVLRMGRLIQFIPHPVTTGFTSGIAVVIATLQIKDFLGLQMDVLPDHYLDRVGALILALPTFSLAECAVGVFTLILLIAWPRFSKKVPAPLIALTAAAVGAVIAEKYFPGFHVATIGSRFSFEVNGLLTHGIPKTAPVFHAPWTLAGPGGLPLPLTWGTLEALLPSAFAIAMLGAIESLLSAVVADGMGGTRHDPDGELLALGTGNLLCPFFGGIPATGAIARTAANIRFGAKSPLAAVSHALFILLAVLTVAPLISYLPMSSLAALLLVVAYNMSEVKHFKHILRVAPKSDVAVLLTCFGLTVLFDMVKGVSVGIVLAAFLFMRRMAALSSGRALSASTHGGRFPDLLPKGVLVYEIAGPLFFGAAEQAVRSLELVEKKVRVLVFLMEDVPAMDMTGLVALESAVEDLIRNGQRAFFVGVCPQPAAVMRRSPVFKDRAKTSFFATLSDALAAVDNKEDPL